MSYVIFFSLQTLLEHAHQEQIFSSFCFSNSPSQTLDRIPVQTFGANEDWLGGLGHTLVNEENL